jgi:hypothetical protein
MARRYHYEYAAYTDNLMWGRILIARGRKASIVRMHASRAGLGCFRIKRERVYD